MKAKSTIQAAQTTPTKNAKTKAAGWFTPALFSFLRELRENNERPWFEANKARYEADVKAPLVAFLDAFRPRLFDISPHFVVGAPFRIHRDIRFSKDKSPYKTHAAAHARHESATHDVHAPGFYVHIEPGSVFVGAGMWEPDNRTLAKVRDALVADPAAWKKLVSAKRFRERCALEGESLQRVPSGYDRQHPLADELRRKSFIAVVRLDERAACSPAFLDEVTAAFEVTAPLARVLTAAVGLPF